MPENDETESSTAAEIVKEQNKAAIRRIRRLIAELREIENHERRASNEGDSEGDCDCQ